MFNDPRAQFMDEVTLADLRYQDDLGESLNFSGRLYLGDYRYEGTLPYDPVPTTNVDSAEARWWGAEGMLTWGGTSDHRLSAGFEFEQQPVRDQKNADINPPIVYLDDHRSSSRYGLFVQDEWRLAPGWIVNLGLRHDHYSEFGGSTNPRLALVHQRGEHTWKLLYGSAFRAPSAYEAYYNDGGLSQLANPNLQPETIQSWELSWERRWGLALRTLASLYHYRVEDLITQMDIVGGLFQYQNAASMTANGLELEAEYAWSSGVRLKGSYAWQNVEAANGNTPTNSPEHLAKLNLAAPLPYGLQAGAELLAMSKRNTMSGEVDANAVFNLTLSGGSRDGLSWSLSAYNLFDSEYNDPASAEFVQDAIPQQGRALRFKLDWRF
jgi:iron complex outermembrane receptor protein